MGKPDGCWGVGVTGGRTTLVEHWTSGSTWTAVPSPSPGAGLNFLTGIDGISPTDAWAVGTDSNADGSSEQSLILHWDGTAWTPVATPSAGGTDFLSSVAANASAGTWAVGFSGPTPTQTLAFPVR